MAMKGEEDTMADLQLLLHIHKNMVSPALRMQESHLQLAESSKH